MYRDPDTLKEAIPVHLAQAKCYAHIYALQHGLDEIGVQMTYCSLETEEIRRFREMLPAKELSGWFQEVTDAYRKWAEFLRDWRELRRASIQGLEFPYPWRAGQKKLAMDVYRTILRKKNLFLQAPTGTGKTLKRKLHTFTAQLCLLGKNRNPAIPFHCKIVQKRILMVYPSKGTDLSCEI